MTAIFQHPTLGLPIYGMIVLDQNGWKQTPHAETVDLFAKVAEIMGHGMRVPESYPPQHQDDRWYMFWQEPSNIERAMHVVQTMPFKLTVVCAFSREPRDGKVNTLSRHFADLVRDSEDRIRRDQKLHPTLLPCRWVGSQTWTAALQHGDLSFLTDKDQVEAEVCRQAVHVEKGVRSERLRDAREQTSDAHWELEAAREQLHEYEQKLIESREQREQAEDEYGDWNKLTG